MAISLASVFLLIEGGGSAGALSLPLAVAAVPLGWLTIHAMVAFHYANLYYAPDRNGDAAGSSFPRRRSRACGTFSTTPTSSA